MEKKEVLKIIIKQLLFILIIIASAGLTAILVSLIVAKLTENVESIVISCLISIWVVETLIVALRNRMVYTEKVKTIETNDLERLGKEKNKLKIRYVLITFIFSLFLCYVMYSLKNSLINSLNGTGEEMDYSNIIHFRLFILGVLIIIYTIRMYLKKKSKLNKDKEQKTSA